MQSLLKIMRKPIATCTIQLNAVPKVLRQTKSSGSKFTTPYTADNEGMNMNTLLESFRTMIEPRLYSYVPLSG